MRSHSQAVGISLEPRADPRAKRSLSAPSRRSPPRRDDRGSYVRGRTRPSASPVAPEHNPAMSWRRATMWVVDGVGISVRRTSLGVSGSGSLGVAPRGPTIGMRTSSPTSASRRPPAPRRRTIRRSTSCSSSARPTPRRYERGREASERADPQGEEESRTPSGLSGSHRFRQGSSGRPATAVSSRPAHGRGRTGGYGRPGW